MLLMQVTASFMLEAGDCGVTALVCAQWTNPRDEQAEVNGEIND